MPTMLPKKLWMTYFLVCTIMLSTTATPASESKTDLVIVSDEVSPALSPESWQQQKHNSKFLPFPGVDITGCFSALFKVEGCALQIVQSIFEGHLIGLSPACCDIIDDIKDNCIPKILPFPDFPIPFLFGNCGKSSQHN